VPDVVFDEWLLDYIEDSQRTYVSLGVLLCVTGLDLTIIEARGSPFSAKLYSLSKVADGWEPRRRLVLKYVFRNIVSDSHRFGWVEMTDLPELSPGLTSRVPEEDRYIVRTALASTSKRLVTTDGELLDRLRDCEELSVFSCDEFIRKNCVPTWFKAT
jgi:hypothetical protein